MDNSFTNMSDEELVSRSLADQAAFAEIISRYQDKISRYIRRLAKVSPEDVEDLLQDIFLKVYINLNGYDSTWKFSSWVYRIAHNVVVSHWRKEKTRPSGHTLDLDDDMLYNISSEINSEEQFSRNFVKSDINKAIMGLNEKYRQVLILYFLEEKIYQEISDILQIPPGTVATRLARGKKQLQQKLTQQGYGK